VAVVAALGADRAGAALAAFVNGRGPLAARGRDGQHRGGGAWRRAPGGLPAGV
jgi:hypothetical protein